MLTKLARYQTADLIKSRWFFAQAIFFAFCSFLLLKLAGSLEKALVGFTVLSVLFLPLFILMVSVSYLYGNRSFVELLLTLPVGRSSLFLSTFLSISVTGFLSYIAGSLIPFLYLLGLDMHVLNTVLLSSCILFPFTALGILIPSLVEDRLKGTALALLFWLFTSILYDALLLYLIVLLNAYPVEILLMFLTLINPLDAVRIVVLLDMGLKEFAGPTGEMLSKYSGAYRLVPVLSSALYTLLCLVFGVKSFGRRDF